MEINLSQKNEYKKIKHVLINVFNSKNEESPSLFTFSLFETPKRNKRTNNSEDLEKTINKKIGCITNSNKKEKVEKKLEYNNMSVLNLNIEYNDKTLNFEVWPQENSSCIAKRIFHNLGMVASIKQLKNLSTIIQNQINTKINEMILKDKKENEYEKKAKHFIIRKFETPDINNDHKNSLIYGNCLIGQLKIDLSNNKTEILKLTSHDDPEKVALEFVQKFNLKNKMFSNILNALNDLKENWEKNFDLEEENRVDKHYDNLVEAKHYFYFYYDHVKETHKIKINKDDDLQRFTKIN